MLQILPDHFEAVPAVKRKHQQDGEVRNEQRPIEKFQVMHAVESVVKQRADQLIGRRCREQKGWSYRYNHKGPATNKVGRRGPRGVNTVRKDCTVNVSKRLVSSGNRPKRPVT
jgi:hypothetical protein